MTNNRTIEEQLFIFAHYLKEVDMFPVFFAAHFSIACIIVREDSKDLGPKFRQNHPFAIWLCSVLASVAGVFVANFLFGEPFIGIMKEHTLIIFITILWYLINYSPFDVAYKVVRYQPIFLSAAILQECLRVRYIYLGLQQAATVYPGAYIIMLIGGCVKGNGYGYLKVVERLIRGKWTPSTNEILDVTYAAKSSLYASILFLLHHLEVLSIPIEVLYFGIIAAFVIFRLVTILGGVTDPLLPLELPICTLLFGSSSEDKQKIDGRNVEREKNDKAIKSSPSKEKQDRKTK